MDRSDRFDLNIILLDFGGVINGDATAHMTHTLAVNVAINFVKQPVKDQLGLIIAGDHTPHRGSQYRLNFLDYNLIA